MQSITRPLAWSVRWVIIGNGLPGTVLNGPGFSGDSFT
jgi:hypothetical protein